MAWEGGCIFFKENTVTSGFVLDKDDNSITRSDAQYRQLFRDAGMELVCTRQQDKFPAELFDVMMYAIR